MTLEGRRVRLGPLEPRHEEALWEVAQEAGAGGACGAPASLEHRLGWTRVR